ncbi:MAG TPA: hypothetical protein PKJ58_06355 [Prolixibacteraceae bacterium]|nr:hypothetical protein [Prolixibacteraceae bacterium]
MNQLACCLKRVVLLLFLPLLLLTGTPLSAQNPSGAANPAPIGKALKKKVSARKVPRELEQITPELMARHIGFLASDSMKGRNTPSPELDQAAEYIAAEFSSLGISPVGGVRFQEVPLHTKSLD